MGVNLGVDGNRRQQLEPAQEDAGCEGFSDPTQGQGAQRHAKLDRRQKVVQLMLQPADRARAWNACGSHLLDTRIAHAHQCELGSHKERVDQYQHANSDELQQRQTVHLACENSIGVRLDFCTSLEPTKVPLRIPLRADSRAN